MINSVHSVHTLVRLLKSPTDPPTTLGPSKIEIACLAWSDSTFRAANKGEVIGEWVLALLGQAKKTKRQKAADPVSDPIADSRYWTLLSDLLTRPVVTARPVKTWVLPLLSRLQLDTIVTELLAIQSSQVLAPARLALTILWPLAEKKISADALEECLGAVFDALVHWERVDDNLAWICSAVVGAYRNALANTGNKKKARLKRSSMIVQFYSSFLSTHFSCWLSVVCASPSLFSPLPTKQLEDSIYAAGIDTVFSLDALKQPLDTLFDAVSTAQSTIPSLLSLLPRLFASFLSAMHRHRSALLVTATSALSGKEEVRRMGMEFVKRCWILIQGPDLQEDTNAEKWRSIISVFSIVEKERLFVPYSLRGTHMDPTNSECSGEVALSQARDKAVETLENAATLSEDHGNEQVVVSIQLLVALVRIEYDFIGSTLERILSALINMSSTLLNSALAPSSEFLSQVLEYHTKTRTVHTYTSALLSAVVANPNSSAARTAASSYRATFPLAYHLPVLARALRTSLTPAQVIPLATVAFQAVERSWIAIKVADQREIVTKKRRIIEDMEKSEPEVRTVSALVRTFSFTSRIAVAVLSNLPSNAYTEDGDEYLKRLWKDAGKLGWTIIWDCLKEKAGKKGQARRSHDKKRKQASGVHGLYPHIAASAMLRFLYDVRCRVSSPLGEFDQLRKPDVETLLDVVQDGASDPELVLETIRTLFWHIWYTQNCESEKQIEIQPIFTATLNILTARISLKSWWSGTLADLNGDNLGLAILYVLADRWIEVIDALGSSGNLEKLISLLFAVPLDLLDDVPPTEFDESHPQNGRIVITSRVILFKLLRNAHFWELHNIRAVFLSSVLSLTAPLSSYCSSSDGVKLPLSAAAQAELACACNVYRLLGYVPREYFTRPVRSELIKRAMAGDVQICAVLASVNNQRSEVARMNVVIGDMRKSHTEDLPESFSAEDPNNWFRQLTFLRAFLQRMGQFLNTSNHTTSLSFVNHLLSPPCISFPPNVLINQTLELIQLHVLGLLRSQETEAVASISSIISTYIAAGQPNFQETWAHCVIQPSLFKFIERLTSDFDSSSLSDEVKDSLKTLRDALESALLPHIQQSVANEPAELCHSLPSERISAWSRVLSLTRWLGIPSPVVFIPLGQKLATSVIRSGTSEIPAMLNSETCSSILRLLFEELWCISHVSHRAHLDVLVGFYVVNVGYCGSNQIESMDTYITQASRNLSVDDFSFLLDIIAEGIGGSGLAVRHREQLIHLATVALRDPPQGTLRVIQNFVTRCLNTFVNQEEIYGGSSSLKARYLEFTASHCSERPVAIRSVDLGNIWSFINKILTGTTEHDSTTTLFIFHHIVAVVGALVRLRRDLVVHTLPHLSLIICQLMMLTRRIRPLLGAKQSKIVTDTFPSWLSASQPISTDEGRALARLLTSLTTKTVPRTHAYGHPSTSTESQKAESLAKPFSKHASYVLVAYVDAFNDPLCIINAEMRRELEPGLFALCEMVGEHSRDALTVSMLDSGGKMIMKSLWRDYEKQRYVGKG